MRGTKVCCFSQSAGVKQAVLPNLPQCVLGATLAPTCTATVSLLPDGGRPVPRLQPCPALPSIPRRLAEGSSDSSAARAPKPSTLVTPLLTSLPTPALLCRLLQVW